MSAKEVCFDVTTTYMGHSGPGTSYGRPLARAPDTRNSLRALSLYLIRLLAKNIYVPNHNLILEIVLRTLYNTVRSSW